MRGFTSHGLRSVSMLMLLTSLAFTCCAERDSTVYWNGGLYSEYSRSGLNTIALGPALYRGKYNDKQKLFGVSSIYLGAGYAWTPKTDNAFFTAGGITTGYWPGFTFGITSQQYHNIALMNGQVGTDVRLSGEVVFVLFGWIGYRYQYPIIHSNESPYIARHAFLIQLPFPIPGKGKTFGPKVTW